MFKQRSEQAALNAAVLEPGLGGGVGVKPVGEWNPVWGLIQHTPETVRPMVEAVSISLSCSAGKY